MSTDKGGPRGAPPSADRDQARRIIAATKERVHGLRHVSDEERIDIQRSATRAALAVQLEQVGLNSRRRDPWSYVGGVALGLLLCVLGLLLAANAGLNLTYGLDFSSTLSFNAVPIPINPSQIVVAVGSAALVAAIYYSQQVLDTDWGSYPYAYMIAFILMLGSYLLNAMTGPSYIPFNGPLGPILGSINWLLYLPSVFTPTAIGMTAVACLHFVRTRSAIRRGGAGRIVDHLILEMLDWAEELESNSDCWRTQAQRKHLLRHFSDGATTVESRLRRELDLLYGARTVKRLGIGTKAILVGGRLREHAAAVALLVLAKHVEELRSRIERTLWAASVGDWEFFGSSAIGNPQRAWWRRHARRVLLGATVVALGLWAPHEWFEVAGLETQRNTFLIIGAGIVASNGSKVSDLLELAKFKGTWWALRLRMGYHLRHFGTRCFLGALMVRV